MHEQRLKVFYLLSSVPLKVLISRAKLRDIKFEMFQSIRMAVR